MPASTAPARDRPASPQARRARQMLPGAGVLVAAIAIAAGFQWAAVAEHVRRSAWNGATTLQIVVLVLTTVATAWLACGLTTARSTRGARWTVDWLGDAALLAARIPVLGPAVTAGTVAWIRRRAILVFATALVTRRDRPPVPRARVTPASTA